MKPDHKMTQFDLWLPSLKKIIPPVNSCLLIEIIAFYGSSKLSDWKTGMDANSAGSVFLALSPLPSSKKSVMVAEVQRLQGLEASMEVRMDDMSRLSLFTPKRSSQNLESSWDNPRR